jgi:hypothetical protein
MEDSRLGELPRKGTRRPDFHNLNEEVGYGGKEKGEGWQGKEEGWQEEEVVPVRTFDRHVVPIL